MLRASWSSCSLVAVCLALPASGQCLPFGCDYDSPESECGCSGNLKVSLCGQDLPTCQDGMSYPEGHECEGESCSSGTPNCRDPLVPQDPIIESVVQPDGKYTARMVFEVTVPWNREAADGDGVDDSINSTLQVLWFEGSSLCSGAVSSCEYRASDDVRVYLERNDLTCEGAPYDLGTYSIRFQVCQGEGPCPFLLPLTCGREVDRVGKAFTVTADDLGCPPPPPDHGCPEDDGCRLCPGGIGAGGGGAGAGGSGAPGSPATGTGAYLYYTAGGVGHPTYPGTAEWTPVLGRYWSHSYARRIVVDPDDSHVWLLTAHGTFREFGDLSGGEYRTLRPSDEYRTLYRTATGWELHDLDGTVSEFDGSGLWLSTTDRHGNATTGTYSGGRLVEVAFPDGRTEELGYHASGRLATITEVGLEGKPLPSWMYTWTGDDLTRIDRPDGTAVEYTYGDPDHPGYLTLIELVGTDGSRRVEKGFEYDAEGNAVRTWRGAASFGDPAAVDTWELAFDDPANPTTTEVTDPLGHVATYTIERDPAGAKPRLDSISGDCPVCDLGPTVDLDYGDPVNPLLPTEERDGDGTVTRWSYTGHGRPASRIEADATGLERETRWAYDATYPALVTSITRPSVEGPPSEAVTTIGRDGSGNPVSRTEEGVESGSFFSTTTARTFTAEGRLDSVDPPGYGTADATSFTYDPSRGGLVVASRTDPLVGTTTYGYDPFHRRTSVTDPNGVTTETAYDDLDRVTRVTRKGATEAGDLVTEHVHGPLGDRVRTVLPEGNVIEYGYDGAGRLVSVERKPDAVTAGERTVYQLDAVGNRTREEQQRWDAGSAAWITESFTEYRYANRCQLEETVHADGTVTEYEYGCDGNLSRVWDANHPSQDRTQPATTEYSYDELDRLTTVTRPWAGEGGGVSETTYGYDPRDHLTSVTDAEGNVTTYTYSDRDLLTEEVSPVSGTTTRRYNEHGELVETIDARGVQVLRTVDELDRVTFVDYPDDTLDTTYTYDDPGVAFSLGRLTAITRDGHTVAYEYDRFGRTTRDGDLTYGYDRNGNRTTLTQPGLAGEPDVTASYQFNYADRPVGLSVDTGSGAIPVVTAAGYLPSGPLASLELGNGTTELRTFTERYFAASIALDADQDRSWTYSTDSVGNITEIVSTLACPGDVVLENEIVTGEEVHTSCAAVEAGPAYTVDTGADVTLRAATRVVLKDGFSVGSGASFRAGTDPSLSGDGTKSYAYQDYDYFLATATGPWGTKSWTYDRIGNRLTETDGDGTDIYSYTLNATGGNTARLDSVDLPAASPRTYDYTPAGHQTQVAAGANVVDFTYDDAGRLAEASRESTTTPFLYDGRSFLRHAGDLASTGKVEPRYDSAGLLHALLRQPSTTDPETLYLVVSFAGRPVAQVALEADQADRWWYFTTDHLGTPLVATDSSGTELWHNRFEPFGRDMDQGLPWNALASEIFLRFPGQWEDTSWQQATLGAEVYYNVYRWYSPTSSRYTRVDPLALNDPLDHPYVYGVGNAILYFDSLGLAAEICCRLLNNPIAGNLLGQRHCYVVADGGDVYGLYPQPVVGKTLGVPRRNDRRDKGGICYPCPCGSSGSSGQDQCLETEYQRYPVGDYDTLGPNSNTFVGTLGRACCKGGLPSGIDNAPGLTDSAPTDTGLRPVPDTRR